MASSLFSGEDAIIKRKKAIIDSKKRSNPEEDQRLLIKPTPAEIKAQELAREAAKIAEERRVNQEAKNSLGRSAGCANVNTF